jgi:hypothetical protein
MAGLKLDLGGGVGELEGMLSELSAAEQRAQGTASSKEGEDELSLLRMTIQACKADLIDLLDKVSSGEGLSGEDVEMLVNYLRSEIRMVMGRLMDLMTARQARRQRRLMDRAEGS